MPNPIHQLTLDGESLTIEDVVAVAHQPEIQVSISAEAWTRVRRAARAVQDFVARGEIVYGITTGFGAFKDKIISPALVEQLQRNILVSHAVGVGQLLDQPTTRAMMLIRANTLAKGHSGIREETLRLLLELLNRGVYPLIPEQGSLGASGDLAPLAHMALPLIGEGEAFYHGERLSGAEALKRAGLSPVTLTAKEGLALTNGTTLMNALGVLVTYQAEQLATAADLAGALSLEAMHGTPRAFDLRIHAARPHPRQMECAAFMRKLIEGSTFTRPDDPLNVQDAYTLRCIPQVHGAVRDAIAYARWVMSIELNSVTDNPLIFFDKNDNAEVISGGNFHGEPLAIAMDYLSIALSELGNISERRIARLVDAASNKNVLPAFLIDEGGVNSGFMLIQYTAAALASENKVLSHPASVDTISTSANIEDHVSMGPAAARQAREIAGNVETILALELLSAAQGIDFRRKILGPEAKMGQGTAPAYALIRQQIAFIERDQVMYPHIETMRKLLADGSLTEHLQ
ncbi:MAG: histidine ammonia-lyase [Chloroflexi bacterium HGW-Chloroflexi-6]|nr:MAG: histidine ammonia-lyase [Chloroflexi bacterium HGW-Chloroflexi-6]